MHLADWSLVKPRNIRIALEHALSTNFLLILHSHDYHFEKHTGHAPSRLGKLIFPLYFLISQYN